MAQSQSKNERPAPTPKYRRQKSANGHDRAFVVLDGKRIYLGPYNSKESREKYHRLLAEWTANGESMPIRHRKMAMFGRLVIPMIRGRLVPTWIRASTYTVRRPNGVITSLVKKSQAQSVSACCFTNALQVGPLRSGEGSISWAYRMFLTVLRLI